MATKESYQKHREKRLAEAKIYYQKNKEKIKARAKKWYQENKERAAANQKISGKMWYEKNKKTKLQAAKKRREKRKNEIFNFLGGAKCSTCGFSDIRALQIDHINGGGRKELKTRGNSYLRFMKDIKQNPEKYQILCANCNWIKRIERKEYK